LPRSRFVQARFQFPDRFQKLVAIAEQFNDFQRRAKVVQRLDAEDADVFQGGDPLVGVLVQQRFQHGSGLLAETCEIVPLADVFGPLAACQRRLAIGDVADQIERVQFLAYLFGQGIQQYALPLQLVDDCFLLLGRVPTGQELVQQCVLAQDRFPSQSNSIPRMGMQQSLFGD
jgi:hypothetical protein